MMMVYDFHNHYVTIHIFSARVAAAEAASVAAHSNSSYQRSGPICKYFLQRRCRNGDACRFAHNEEVWRFNIFELDF
jgi:hypothetical protein